MPTIQGIGAAGEHDGEGVLQVTAGVFTLLPRIEAEILRAAELLATFRNGHVLTLTSLQEVVREAFYAMDAEYNERTAIKWAQGYQFPADIGTRDLRDLIQCGNYPQTIG